MDFKLMLLSLLGFQSTLAKVEIKYKEKMQIIKAVNEGRRHVKAPAQNMKSITWDYELENDIRAFNVSPSWFYENSTKYSDNQDIHYDFNLRFLMKEPEFKKYDDRNYSYIFHDTCNNGAGNVLGIFKFRLRQKDCFKYSKCSQDTFTNFQSCSSVPIVRGSGMHCSWSWRYYTPLIRDDLKNIACMRLGIPGPFTPSHQKDAFACYGQMPQATNDIPYKARLKSKL